MAKTGEKIWRETSSKRVVISGETPSGFLRLGRVKGTRPRRFYDLPSRRDIMIPGFLDPEGGRRVETLSMKRISDVTLSSLRTGMKSKMASSRRIVQLFPCNFQGINRAVTPRNSTYIFLWNANLFFVFFDSSRERNSVTFTVEIPEIDYVQLTFS